MTERAFADAAVESSHVFRAIMQAMARPGTVQHLTTDLVVPAPLVASTAAVALTLCDFQTPIWLGPGLNHEAMVHYLKFHTGAPVVEAPADAAFAFMLAGESLSHPSLFPQGSHEYPDRSATLVIQVTKLGGNAVRLSGPGIDSSAEFAAAGLDTDFWVAMSQNHSGFPLGIDTIFAAPGQIAAVPRSTAVHLEEAA